MDIISSPGEMQTRAIGWKKQFKIGLVPTMGCMHEGHLSLIRIAQKQCDKVILTIFVNPMQFGPNEDLEAYPRQFETDCDLAQKEGADVVFAPDSKAMYDDNFQTAITVNKLSKGMCGEDRPGHFDGVATVVTKLFNLTVPDVAVFGEKDFQQLAVIRQLVRDLNLPIEIAGGPIVREQDGLAMSSRNKYLQGEHRLTALCLSQAIEKARETAQSASGKKPEYIIEAVKAGISEAGAQLEYAVIVNEYTLESETVVGPNSVLAVAAKIDQRVRLIDNAKLLVLNTQQGGIGTLKVTLSS